MSCQTQIWLLCPLFPRNRLGLTQVPNIRGQNSRSAAATTSPGSTFTGNLCYKPQTSLVKETKSHLNNVNNIGKHGVCPPKGHPCLQRQPQTPAVPSPSLPGVDIPCPVGGMPPGCSGTLSRHQQITGPLAHGAQSTACPSVRVELPSGTAQVCHALGVVRFLPC